MTGDAREVTGSDPVATQIAGLPGAQELASVSGGQNVWSGISGNPPEFHFTAEHVGTTYGEFDGIRETMYIESGITPDAAAWRQGFQQGLLDAFLRCRPCCRGRAGSWPAGRPALIGQH